MKIKPILFNTEMVRAILDGRKACTRRLVKLPSYIKQQEDGLYTLYAEGTCYENQYLEEIISYIKQPYQPGDILYVRETWHKYTKRIGKGESCRLAEFYGYKASVANSEDAEEPWKPSIHMPKKAARIWLKVTDVRVERLQDITSEQIGREGVEVEYPHVLNGEEKRYAFSTLWNSTIQKSDLDRYGWNANPWVWVIEFERCGKPKGGD